MSISLRVAAILFDLDGVLVDSHLVVERTWLRWAERAGIDEPDLVRRAHGRRSIETVREVAPHLDADEEVRWLAEAELSDFDGVAALPGTTLLQELRAGEWAVVTSGGRELARRRLEHVKLPRPEILIAAEDVTDGKPAPDGYLMAAARLGHSTSQCLVIEDTPAGIRAARSAGARTVALTTTFPDIELTGADTIVKNLADVSLERSFGGLTLHVR